jgi:hypothetical protein
VAFIELASKVVRICACDAEFLLSSEFAVTGAMKL